MKRSFRLENLDARLVWWPINSRHQTTVESTYQALFKVRNFRRRSIRTQHNLPTTLVQGIECVKEFFLRLFVLGEEVNVIDHQHVHIPKPVSKLHHSSRADRFVEHIHERAAGDVNNSSGWVAPQHLLTHSLEQVSLSHPNATMHKEWVVSTARLERYGLCSSVTKAIVWSNHKCLKYIIRRQQDLFIKERLSSGPRANSVRRQRSCWVSNRRHSITNKLHPNQATGCHTRSFGELWNTTTLQIRQSHRLSNQQREIRAINGHHLNLVKPMAL